MAQNTGIQIEGLKEFRAALKAADAELVPALRVGYKKIADKVAREASSSFAGRSHGPGKQTAETVKAFATQTGASIGLGDAAHPYALGEEFGGRARPTTQQFEPWRGAGADAGYSLYPAIRRMRETIVEDLGVLFDGVIRRAFP